MAADVCSDFTPSLVSSPRISFSYDLKDSDIIPDHFLLDPTLDFNFCINPSSSSLAISSADELFSNGKINPVQIKEIPPVIIQSFSRTSGETLSLTHPPFSSTIPRTKPDNTNENAQKKMLKDFLSSTVDDEEEEDMKPPIKHTWQFRRSSSLNSVNSENGRKNNGLRKSLQFLSRSNSTGSTPNPKIVVPQKVTSKTGIARSISEKEHSIKRSGSQKERKTLPRSSSVSSSTQYYAFSSGNKASLRKSYSNVIRISPVLNITPTYFTKGTVNLFGFCSFLSNSKSSKKKK